MAGTLPQDPLLDARPLNAPADPTSSSSYVAPEPATAPNLPANEAGSVAKSPFAGDEASRVREMFVRAREARRPMMRLWKQNYRTLNNKAWTPQSESWMPSPKITQIWPVMFSMVAWQTDQRPSFTLMPVAQPFSPWHDQYMQIAKDMESLIAGNFGVYRFDGEITKVLWDVGTYGIGYYRTGWKPWLADGLGDAAMWRVDPFTVYPDPWARNEDDLQYIIEARTMPISALDRAFPGAAKLVAGNYVVEDIDESPHRLDESVSSTAPRVALGTLDGQSTTWAVGDRKTGIYDEPMVTILECYTRYHVTESADDGTSTVQDRWWCSVVCNDTVLMSLDAAEVHAFGQHPYDRQVLTDTGEWYGPSMVEMLRSPQVSIARTLASIEQNIALMGNPVLVESTRSKSRNHRISNRPGQRIESRPDEIAWLNPPQMQPQIAVSLMQFYKGEIESISGLSAMVRGFSPGGRNSQGVLDSVQDAAFVRVRAQLRELERSLAGVGSKMVATIAEFYTEPRYVATMGPDGQKLHHALRGRHFYMRDPGAEDTPLRFVLVSDAGSQLPTSRQARAAEAERLYNMGAIDTYELLKAKQWPNFSIVAHRMMEQQAAAGQLGVPPNARQKGERV